MRTSEAVEVLVEVGVMGGMNSEAKASFHLVLGLLWDEAEKAIIEELIKMEVEEAAVVVETVGLFRLEVINNSRIFVAGKQF